MKVVRKADAPAKTGLSVRQMDRLEAEGRFPKKIKLGLHSASWIGSELDSWIAARAAERDGRSTPKAA
jgi:prophage regulatory protein